MNSNQARFRWKAKTTGEPAFALSAEISASLRGRVQAEACNLPQDLIAARGVSDPGLTQSGITAHVRQVITVDYFRQLVAPACAELVAAQSSGFFRR